MDFMFEDEVDEVGSDVEAYCPKCKADTTHVVISKYEDEIRRVQCNACGDVHSFRKPRGDVEDDVPEPIAAKKRASVKKLSWEEFFAKHGEKPAKPYEFRERYTENTIVTHPKFGKGFVSEIISESKVEISFKDGRRVLVHNRRDLPGLPLAAEGDGVPSTGGKAKALKEKAEKADRQEKRAAAEKAAPPVADKKKGKAEAPAEAPKAPAKAEPKADVKAPAKAEAKPSKGDADGPSKPVKGDKGATEAARPARPEPKVETVKAEKADKEPKAEKKSAKPSKGEAPKADTSKADLSKAEATKKSAKAAVVSKAPPAKKKAAAAKTAAPAKAAKAKPAKPEKVKAKAKPDKAKGKDAKDKKKGKKK